MKASHIPLSLKEQDKTKEYYDSHAETYAETTRQVDMSSLYDRFLQYVPAQGKLLDAGSGSGRDTLAFLKRGYEVDAFDASPALCKLSSQLTQMPTHLLLFQEFKSAPLYDGVWACASLLHVPKREQKDVIDRLVNALKSEGVFYMSFKHGSRERMTDDGRFFLDLNEPSLRRLFSAFPEMQLVEIWISGGESFYKGKHRWLNAIAVKTLERSD